MDAAEDALTSLFQHPVLSLSFVFGASVLNGRSALTLDFDRYWSQALDAAPAGAGLSTHSEATQALCASNWSQVLSAPRPAKPGASSGTGPHAVSPPASSSAAAASAIAGTQTPWRNQSRARPEWLRPSAWQPRFQGAVARKTVKSLMGSAQHLAVPLKPCSCFMVARSVVATCPDGWRAQQRLRVKLKPPRGMGSPPPSSAHTKLHVSSSAFDCGDSELAQAAQSGDSVEQQVFVYVCQIAVRGAQ